MVGPKIICELQQKTQTSDSMGGFTDSWVRVNDLKGVLTVARGNEFFRDNRRAVISTHYFMCNKPKDITITEEYRIVYNSENYEVLLVNKVAQKNRFLIFELRKID